MSAETDAAELGAESDDVVESASRETVPYMSFQGFRNLLDRLSTEGLPQVFDGSFFGPTSGSLIAQTRATLRFFDLIDEDKRPTAVFRSMIASEEAARIETLRRIAEVKFCDVIALGADATQGQLAEIFRSTGLNGGSLTKAITFYVGLAEYVGLPISPYFKLGRIRISQASGNSSRRSPRRRKVSSSGESALHSTNPPASALPLEEKKSAYIDLLMKLAEQSGDKGEIKESLLDRLERALGYETSSQEE
jgi:hypothetical protein